MANIEVKLTPEVIGQIGPIQVTNAMFTSITISVVLIIIAIFIRRKLSLNPGRLQIILELGIGMILEKMTIAFGSEKRARKYFPLIFTIFLFTIFANYFTVIPFIESIKTADGASVFTTATAHFSQTIALILITLGLAHIIAISNSPIGYVKAFIKIGPIFKARTFGQFGMALIEFFLGLMDIIGEAAKFISVPTRLFGNMLAGGIIITIISGLTSFTGYLLPIPFIALGFLSAIVQAFVFTLLAILFMASIQNAASPLEENSHN